MNNQILAILCFLVGIAMMTLAFPDGLVASMTALVMSAVVIVVIRKQNDKDAEFLIQLFLIGLLVRLLFGLIVHVFDLRSFFAGDANTYNRVAQKVVTVWFGEGLAEQVYNARDISRLNGGSRGMYYLVAILYSILGKNILAAQTFCAVIGAATVPMIYSCAARIFNNRQVGKYAALFIALYPAMVIWTGQLLKDGLIIFLLVVTMTMVLRLQEKFDWPSVIILILALFGIVSLRFYIFYMAILAVVGSFVVGTGANSQSVFKRFGVLIVLGLGLTYFGVLRNAGDAVETFTDLERVQVSRADLAEGGSGFGEELDVSTTEGAILTMPVGLAYLMLAPFPWQMTNFRQLITLPEVLLWWSMIPFLISGLIYTVKNRLRNALAILIFSVMLTMGYSIFQGNVGTAYRQRSQIQIFLFIFISAGWVLHKERKENKRLAIRARNQEIERRLKINREAGI